MYFDLKVNKKRLDKHEIKNFGVGWGWWKEGGLKHNKATSIISFKPFFL
jgi:hypothetical protein